MYSVVLMAALAAGGEAPACHWGCGGCYGCCGCYGGCYGCYGGCHGCYGCYGGCYGCSGCYGCYGCSGCWGCYGGGVIVAPAAGMPAETVPPPKPEMKKGETSASRTGKLLVELPADAKLFIDDHQMKTESGKRNFNTPVLEVGQLYYYMVRAEVVRDGKTYSDVKRVIVRAGVNAQVAFPEEQLVKETNEVKSVVSAR